jgi:hypothetical protein
MRKLDKAWLAKTALNLHLSITEIKSREGSRCYLLPGRLTAANEEKG